MIEQRKHWHHGDTELSQENTEKLCEFLRHDVLFAHFVNSVVNREKQKEQRPFFGYLTIDGLIRIITKKDLLELCILLMERNEKLMEMLVEKKEMEPIRVVVSAERLEEIKKELGAKEEHGKPISS